MSIRSLLFSLLPAAGYAASLLVSHYNGNIYSLSLTTSGATGTLAITSTLKAGGNMPSWLTLDSATRNLYITDETSYGGAVLTTLAVQADGSLKALNTARTTGGEVHSTLYGGSNGTGFIAAAE